MQGLRPNGRADQHASEPPGGDHPGGSGSGDRSVHHRGPGAGTHRTAQPRPAYGHWGSVTTRGPGRIRQPRPDHPDGPVPGLRGPVQKRSAGPPACPDRLGANPFTKALDRTDGVRDRAGVRHRPQHTGGGVVAAGGGELVPPARHFPIQGPASTLVFNSAGRNPHPAGQFGEPAGE